MTPSLSENKFMMPPIKEETMPETGLFSLEAARIDCASAAGKKTFTTISNTTIAVTFLHPCLCFIILYFGPRKVIQMIAFDQQPCGKKGASQVGVGDSAHSSTPSENRAITPTS
jgi:hypothetical protein